MHSCVCDRTSATCSIPDICMKSPSLSSNCVAWYSSFMDSKTDGGEELNPPTHKPKGAFALREEEVLAFWDKEQIFEQTLTKDAPKGEYMFYDGPPFATGLPHYGHLLQSALKDAIPRYKTMQGYRVPRQWGWDCHGLPLENQIEQELGFKTKRDIEQYGIEKFNTAAKNAVLRYAADWRRIIPRVGRWADMEHDYKTMDATYTESVWWAFKNLYDKGLIYEGFKAMHFCARCGTTLSNNEVALGYQDIDDHAVTVKLPLVAEPETALLIWTTTPWTLPGNSAAAVNAGATYVKVRTDEGFVIVAKELMHKVLGENAQVFGEILGKDLVGQRYEPPFPYFKDLVHKHKTHAWKVYAAPYVTLEVLQVRNHPWLDNRWSFRTAHSKLRSWVSLIDHGKPIKLGLANRALLSLNEAQSAAFAKVVEQVRRVQREDVA